MQPHLPRCGGRLRPPANDAGFTVTARFPRSAERGSDVTVELSCTRPVRGVTSPYADVYLVRDGRVVAVPGATDCVGLLLDLQPGDVVRLTARIEATSCADDRPLPPGRYEAYARLVVHPDIGPAADVWGGGPSPLDLR